jgi:hypothetical protein
MMANVTNDALRKLIEAVEANEPIPVMRADELGMSHTLFMDALDGSLDAARALHEAVLPPDHQWVVGSMRDGKRSLTFSGAGDEPNPARAWLLAILKALAAQGGRDE